MIQLYAKEKIRLVELVDTRNDILVDGEKVGYIEFYRILDSFCIEDFYIYPSYRNKGYGSAMMDLMKSQRKTKMIYGEAARSAIPFLKKNGADINSNDVVEFIEFGINV